MDAVLYVRETVLKFYKRYEGISAFAFKLIAGIFIFAWVGGIGYVQGNLKFLFDSALFLPFLLMMAVLFAVLPPVLANLLVILAAALQLSALPELMILVFALLLCVIIFYGRMAPKKSFLVLGILIGFYFRIPAAVVIFAGLYAGMTSIIPVAAGTVIWHIKPVISDIAVQLATNRAALPPAAEEFDIMQMPANFSDIYRMLFDGISADYTWLTQSFVFALVIVAVYVISRFDFDRAKEMAIIAGGAVNIICSVVVYFILSRKIGFAGTAVSSAVSVLLMFPVRFLDSVLDYKNAERVQFEDEDNYYYVKIIPKMFLKKEDES